MKGKNKLILLYRSPLGIFPYLSFDLTRRWPKIWKYKRIRNNIKGWTLRRWKRKSFVIAGKSSLFCLYILLLTRTHHQRSNKISPLPPSLCFNVLGFNRLLSFIFVPGGYIPTLETKQRECWKVSASRCEFRV